MSCELVKGCFHFYFITSVLGEGRVRDREIRIGRKREEEREEGKGERGGEGEVSRRKTRKENGEIKS